MFAVFLIRTTSTLVALLVYTGCAQQVDPGEFELQAESVALESTMPEQPAVLAVDAAKPPELGVVGGGEKRAEDKKAEVIRDKPPHRPKSTPPRVDYKQMAKLPHQEQVQVQEANILRHQEKVNAIHHETQEIKRLLYQRKFAGLDEMAREKGWLDKPPTNSNDRFLYDQWRWMKARVEPPLPVFPPKPTGF